MGSNFSGELAALATAGCWTITSLAFEAAGRRVGSLSVNLIRLAMAMGLLAVFCWLRRGLWWPSDASAHAWMWLSLSGLVGFTIGDLCLFRAFVVIGARLSMLLMSLVPLFTILGGFLVLREGISAVQTVGMALTLAGVIWVVIERRPAREGVSARPPWTGILLGLGGAAGQALGLVLSKLGMGNYDPFAATQIRVLAGVVSFGLLFVVIGWWGRVLVALRNPVGMAYTGLGAFFGPFLGVSLSLVAVQVTKAGVAATLMALVPVLILVPARLLFKERISLRAVLGACLAVAGSALLFLAPGGG